MFSYTDRLSNISLKEEQIQKVRLLFYSLWLIINLVQAAFTNLIFDEAYYWVCSTELAWGHYHHPPLISIMIKAGYFLFSNELGVRFFFVLASTGGIYLLEKLLLKKDLLLYYAIVISIVPFQVAGILAAPDIALFFLSVTFYHLFRRFLESNNWIITILLSLNTALLLYAKYHGIIVIGFSFLYNFMHIIRRPMTWVWVFTSVLFFLPHVFWQISNEFPTISFHLFERPGKGVFKIINIIDYIPGQLLMAGPLVGFVLFWSLFKVKAEGRFEKTMFFNVVAMYLFFQVIAIYHHIEANWTIVGFAPLIVLSHKALTEHERLRKWIYRLLPFSLLLALIFRIILLFPAILKETRVYNELGAYREWAMQIKELAGESPVVFIDRYQRTSQFAFHSGGHPIFTLNPNQKSEFDYLSVEYNIQGKRVLLFANRKWTDEMDSVMTIRGKGYYTFIDNFRSYKKVRLVPQFEKGNQVANNKVTSVFVSMTNPYPYPVTFLENPDFQSTVGFIIYLDGKEYLRNESVFDASLFNEQEEIAFHLPPLPAGEYQMQMIITTGWFPPTRHSRLLKFSVN